MLDNITVHDVILRLNNREKSVSALVGDNKDGWGTKLAWNPVESFKPKFKDLGAIADEFDKFVSNHQSLNRLVIGFITYDFGCLLQGVDLTSEDVLNLPGIHAYAYENWIEFNKSGISIIGNSPEFANEVSELLKRDVSSAPKNLYKDLLRPIDTKSDYLDSFNKLKTYITDGDVYQVNLSQWLEGSTESSGKQVFSSLSFASNSNFQAYIEIGGKEILSFSPERFIYVENNKISTMPIKGTRPRGSSEQEDKFVADELYGNEKEKAELDMIIDLSRNDLGKICTPGSVKVSERRKISYHPTIIDAHGKVEGTLVDSINSIQALISMMPGGSITGCPKRSAIEIIDNLEKNRRGIYTGSIFVVTSEGNLDSNIAIRTMTKIADKLYLPVGGGIVYDSNGNSEYDETLLKAKSFIKLN